MAQRILLAHRYLQRASNPQGSRYMGKTAINRHFNVVVTLVLTFNNIAGQFA